MPLKEVGICKVFQENRRIDVLFLNIKTNEQNT